MFMVCNAEINSNVPFSLNFKPAGQNNVKKSVKSVKIRQFGPKIAYLSHFRGLVRASENFLSLSSDWDLLRISRGTKYLLTKKIVGRAQTGITKIYISLMNPLDPLTMKI